MYAQGMLQSAGQTKIQKMMKQVGGLQGGWLPTSKGAAKTKSQK